MLTTLGLEGPNTQDKVERVTAASGHLFEDAPLASLLTSFLSVLAQQDRCLPLAIKSVKSFAWHVVPY